MANPTSLATHAQETGHLAYNPTTKTQSLSILSLWVWALGLAIVVVYASFQRGARWMRTVACLNDDKQRYFERPHHAHAFFRRHLVDAPLFRKRHHRELKLSTVVNMGVLPSRLQALFVLGFITIMAALIVVCVDFSQPSMLITNELISRTGHLAMVTMLPLFVFAARNNPLIASTGIQFDGYNFLHRWVGRGVVVVSLVHACLWAAGKVGKGGWNAVMMAEKSNSMIISGTVALVPLVAILLLSHSAIRHAFYEIFLVSHKVFAIVAFGGIWIHADSGFSRSLLALILTVWVAERATRLARLVYRNLGAGGTRADVEILPGDAVRITMKVARPWTVQPGQHAFICLPAIGLLSSHPFSIAWSEANGATSTAQQFWQSTKDLSFAEKAVVPLEQEALQSSRKTTLSFIVRRRTGFTNSLYEKAEKSAGHKFSTTAFVEGPYGGDQSLSSYGTVLLFAAGVGITHQIQHIRHLIDGYDNGTVATRRLVLIWIIKSPEHLEWVRPWMTAILKMPRRRELLRIKLFVTQPRSAKEIHSPSASVQMYPGKPNIQTIVDQEVQHAVGAIGINVCGVGGLADDVRSACRIWMDTVNIDFTEESFSR